MDQEVDANLELLNFFARHPLPLAAAASASRGEGGSALLAALGPGAGGPRWAAVAPDVAFFGASAAARVPKQAAGHQGNPEFWVSAVEPHRKSGRIAP